MDSVNTFNDPLMHITRLDQADFHFLLKRLAKLPDSMEMIGTMPPETYKYLCVVGSRSYSSYGREVCSKLIAGLAGYPIVIVSGLAIGIDAFAHEAAIEAGLKTIAFPGSGLALAVLAPTQNIPLARRIIEAGGTLLSPFERNQHADFWTYPVRNKLMAGISNVTLLIEAKDKSGSLLTVNDANEIGRPVLAVPGSIFSHLTQGPHHMIREGATAVTCSADILEALGFEVQESADIELTKECRNTSNNLVLFEPLLSEDEKLVISKLTAPIQRDDFIREVNLPAGYVNAVLAELELKGVIVERQGLLMVN